MEFKCHFVVWESVTSHLSIHGAACCEGVPPTHTISAVFIAIRGSESTGQPLRGCNNGHSIDAVRTLLRNFFMVCGRRQRLQ